MIISKHPIQAFLIFASELILLYGCSSFESTSTANTEITLSTPTDASPSTRTTQSTRISPSASPSLPPTWTPLPAYPSAQVRQMVMDLYENPTCKLPCWWGITPGKTDWHEAWQFLGRFSTNKSPDETALRESQAHPGYIYYQVHLNVPQIPDQYYYFSLNNLWLVINTNTFRVDYIDVNTGNVENYTMPMILSTYGKPQEIYVQRGCGQVSQYCGAAVLLYYPQYGFISDHFTTVDQQQFNGSKITACFQKVTNLYLWSPQQKLDFKERLKISNVDPLTLSMFKSIQEVSNFDVDTFYAKFANTQQQPCIEFNSSN